VFRDSVANYADVKSTLIFNRKMAWVEFSILFLSNMDGSNKITIVDGKTVDDIVFDLHSGWFSTFSLIHM